MPLPSVAIDVSGPNAGAPDAVAALVEGCNEAFAHGHCELRSDAANGDPVVVVRWSNTDELDVSIEIKPAKGDRALKSRQLSFSPSDASVERWRAVGLVAGTLADDALLAAAAPPPRPVERSRRAPSQPEPSRPAISRERAPTWLDAGFATGPAPSGWWLGASLRGAHSIEGPLFGLIGMRYAEQARNAEGVSVRWFSPSLGVGLRLRPERSRFELDLRFEGLAELAQASIVEPATGASGGQSRWALGGRIGAEGEYALGDWLGVFAGGDVSYTGRPIEIRSRGNGVEHVFPTTLALLLGIRVGFP